MTPIFDGTNYIPWSNALRGVFQWSGSWDIVAGNASPAIPTPHPSNAPTNAAADVVATTIAAQAAWDEKNKKALGLMAIYISLDYHSYIGSHTNASEV